MRKSTLLISVGAVIEIVSTIAGVRSNSAMNGLSILTWIGMGVALYGVYLLYEKPEHIQRKQQEND